MWLVDRSIRSRMTLLLYTFFVCMNWTKEYDLLFFFKRVDIMWFLIIGLVYLCRDSLVKCTVAWKIRFLIGSLNSIIGYLYILNNVRYSRASLFKKGKSTIFLITRIHTLNITIKTLICNLCNTEKKIAMCLNSLFTQVKKKSYMYIYHFNKPSHVQQ